MSCLQMTGQFEIKVIQLIWNLNLSLSFQAYSKHIVISIAKYGLSVPFIRTLVKCNKNLIFLFLNKTYIVGTQKNCRNETVLLSTQNIC